MADMTDLKSVANIGVRVQISPFAPNGNVTQWIEEFVLLVQVQSFPVHTHYILKCSHW